MQSPQDQELLKKLTLQLVPDLTRALKLIKTRILLLLKISKQPTEDHHEIVKQVTLQQSEIIKKYQHVDKTLLLGFQMEFQRFFSRIIETVHLEKNHTQLQEYIKQVETIVYQGMAEEKVDYIRVLAGIYSRGRSTTRMLLNQQKFIVKKEKKQEVIINLTKNEKCDKKVVENKEKDNFKIPIKTYSYSLKLLTGLDLDYNFSRDSHLYMLNHQDDTLADMMLRNKPIFSQINTYRKQYTDNITRRQRRSATRAARKLVPASNLETTASSSTRIPSAAGMGEEQKKGKYNGDDGNIVYREHDMMMGTISSKNPPVFSLFKENKKSTIPQQRRTSQSFRLVQSNIPTSKQVTPKKILFAFNKMMSGKEEMKPIQFSIRRKNKQYSQVKTKIKDQTFEILIEGRKIEEEIFQFNETKRRSMTKKNSNSFMCN